MRDNSIYKKYTIKSRYIETSFRFSICILLLLLALSHFGRTYKLCDRSARFRRTCCSRQLYSSCTTRASKIS